MFGLAVAKKRAGVQEIVFFFTALVFAGFFFGELNLRWAEQQPLFRIRDIIVFFAMIVVAPTMAKYFATNRRICAFLARSDRWFILLLTVLAVLPRLIWWLIVPVKIDSDYGFYIQMGVYYAENGKPLIDNYLLTIAPNVVTYSALTGLLMRLFGTSETTMIVFVEILHIFNILLLYGVGRKLTSIRRAFVVAVFFALLPENIFYSNLPGIEAPAMFTELLGLLIILNSKDREIVGHTLACCVGGMVLSFSACIRANAYAVLIATIILMLWQKKTEKAIGKKILTVMPLIIGMVTVFAANQGLKNTLFEDRKPANGLGWSMYEGLDLDNGGKWTSEKSAKCIEVIDAYKPTEANEVFRMEALERFRGYSFGEKVLMILRKGGALWYETRYSLFSLEGTEAEQRLNRLAHYAWAICLAAFISAMLYRLKRPAEKQIWMATGLPICVILLTTVWHMIGTSIGRYHYMLIPFILLTAAILLPGSDKAIACERGDRQ